MTICRVWKNEIIDRQAMIEILNEFRDLACRLVYDATFVLVKKQVCVHSLPIRAWKGMAWRRMHVSI